MADSDPWLIDTTTGEKLAQAQSEGSETTLPDGYSWTWCLDGRGEPYNEMELERVLGRALINRKRYLLVNSDQLAKADLTDESRADKGDYPDETDVSSPG